MMQAVSCSGLTVYFDRNSGIRSSGTTVHFRKNKQLDGVLTTTRGEGTLLLMITTFKDKETEKIYHQVFSKKLPMDIQHVALRKLIMLNNAKTLEDLRIPPSNHLELWN